MKAHELQHVADELEYQLSLTERGLGDLPPTGGLGWATLRLETLAGVVRRASAALREAALDIRS
jgi:hypothetical protein